MGKAGSLYVGEVPQQHRGPSTPSAHPPPAGSGRATKPQSPALPSARTGCGGHTPHAGQNTPRCISRHNLPPSPLKNQGWAWLGGRAGQLKPVVNKQKRVLTTPRSPLCAGLSSLTHSGYYSTSIFSMSLTQDLEKQD